VPASIGPVDVTTFGCVLLHVRDPFLALARGAALARERVVVTELLAGVPRVLARPLRARGHAASRAMVARGTRARRAARAVEPGLRARRESWRPHARPGGASDPVASAASSHLLDFEVERVTYHFQREASGVVPMYTVVARRNRGPCGLTPTFRAGDDASLMSGLRTSVAGRGAGDRESAARLAFLGIAARGGTRGDRAPHRRASGRPFRETGTGKSTLLLSQLSGHHVAFTRDDVGDGDSLPEVRASPLLRREVVEFVVGSTQETLPVPPFHASPRRRRHRRAARIPLRAPRVLLPSIRTSRPARCWCSTTSTSAR
jgi:hypothetical protein